MPISPFLQEKWDARLYNWLLWRSADGEGGGDAKISSIYRPELAQRGYRDAGDTFLSGEAMDTDALMQAIRADKDMGERIYGALAEWAGNDGTRGAQASRLGTHQDTYKDWVDSGMRRLERLSRWRSVQQIKSRRLIPERA